MTFMNKKHYVLLFLICIGNNANHVIANCSINIDSLFNYHILHMDERIRSFIDGEILVSSTANIMADIKGRPIKTNYNDSTKFPISRKDEVFLQMFEFIDNFKWTRNEIFQNIEISRNDVSLIKIWYDKNKDRLNCNKIIGVMNFISDGFRANYNDSVDISTSIKQFEEEQKRLKQMPTFIESK